jgi:hypothetical protein
MSGAVLPLPQYAFMAWCLVKHRDNFTFLRLHGVIVKHSDNFNFTVSQHPLKKKTICKKTFYKIYIVGSLGTLVYISNQQ